MCEEVSAGRPLRLFRLAAHALPSPRKLVKRAARACAHGHNPVLPIMENPYSLLSQPFGMMQIECTKLIHKHTPTAVCFHGNFLVVFLEPVFPPHRCRTSPRRVPFINHRRRPVSFPAALPSPHRPVARGGVLDRLSSGNRRSTLQGCTRLGGPFLSFVPLAFRH